ncbi:MAG: class I tRNA ligase family protein, partial [Eubacteriales bacterium]|nr:class I tRNA ligase family protein [Eubacteriales bacterium]
LPGAEETIMRADWPKADPAYDFGADAKDMEAVMELIRSIRNLRAEMNVPPAKRVSMLLIAKAGMEHAFSTAAVYMNRLAGVDDVKLVQDKSGVPKNAVSLVTGTAEAFIPLEQLVDIEKERERVTKEIARMQGEIARAEGKLNNAGFVAKAPEKVVEEERAKLVKAKDVLEKLVLRQKDLA